MEIAKPLIKELVQTVHAWHKANQKLDSSNNLNSIDKSRCIYECERLERHLNNLIDLFNQVRLKQKNFL